MELKKDIYTPIEVAVILGISITTVYSRINTGDFRAVERRNGAKTVSAIQKQEVERLLKIYKP